MLLERKLVDAVIHVVPCQRENAGAPIFGYAISYTPEQVRAGAKSRYYPVEISGALKQARETELRYAFVGVPCFIKAVRLLQRQESWARERIRFCVGLVCGHLKSAGFGEFLAWQCGVKPDELREVDFRWKLAGRPADHYGIKLAYERLNAAHTLVRPMDELTGDAWGHCLFQVPACNYCDDVVAETADIAIGDAWLPDYTADSGGTNVVINRSETLEQLLTYGVKNRELELRRIAPEMVVKSQAGGFRQRREGLAIRLHNRKQNRAWAPAKRFSALPLVNDRKRQELILLREQMAHASHAAFQEARRSGSLTPYFERMAPLARRYNQLTRTPLARRVIGFPVRVLRRITRLFQ
jgi:coenzyme F420-reducing hydrogenase beta subunit